MVYLAPEGVVCLGVSAQGVSAQGGCVLPRGGVSAMDKDPHPVDKMTDACENITLPQNTFA